MCEHALTLCLEEWRIGNLMFAPLDFLQQLRISLEYVLSDAKAELTRGEFLEEAYHNVLDLLKSLLDVLGDIIDWYIAGPIPLVVAVPRAYR